MKESIDIVLIATITTTDTKLLVGPGIDYCGSYPRSAQALFRHSGLPQKHGHGAFQRVPSITIAAIICIQLRNDYFTVIASSASSCPLRATWEAWEESPHIRKRYHYEFTSCFSCFCHGFYGAYLLMNEMGREITFEHVM